MPSQPQIPTSTTFTRHVSSPKCSSFLIFFFIYFAFSQTVNLVPGRVKKKKKIKKKNENKTRPSVLWFVWMENKKEKRREGERGIRVDCGDTQTRGEMGRKKIEVKLIEDRCNRHVTFCKRRSGLIKKARELSVLCDVEVGLVVFTNRGRLYEFCSGNRYL